MSRESRYFLAGHVWHITHRCHKQEFLLRFTKDKKRWRYWLFEAKKRYGLVVLNYVITSNHIHLLVMDQGRGEISQSMQLIAGRTAQEYNRRKNRKGAFWETRFYATAIDAGAYLENCMTYIDLNMVRAGVVAFPADWEWGGYHAIQYPPSRYTVIDTATCFDIFGSDGIDDFQKSRRESVTEAIRMNRHQVRAEWSRQLAIGRPEYVERVHSILGINDRAGSATSPMVASARESEIAYRDVFRGENIALSRRYEPIMGQNNYLSDV